MDYIFINNFDNIQAPFGPKIQATIAFAYFFEGMGPNLSMGLNF